MSIHALHHEASARAIHDWDASTCLEAVRLLIEAHFKDEHWRLLRLREYHHPAVLLWVAILWRSDHAQRNGEYGIVDMREVLVTWDVDKKDFQLELPE